MFCFPNSDHVTFQELEFASSVFSLAMYAYARGWHDFSKKQFPVVTSHGQQWEDNTQTTRTSQKKVYYIKRERIFKGVRTYYQNRSKFPLFLLFYIITFLNL